MNTVAPRRLLAALALLLSPVVLTACGSSGAPNALPSVAKPSSSAAAPGESKSAAPNGADAFAKFQDCMSSHGVQISTNANSDLSPSHLTQAQIMAAQQDCQKYLQGAGPQQGDQGLPPEIQQKFLAVAKCMRGKGFDVPDPTFNGGQIQSRMPAGDGAVAALNACQQQVGLSDMLGAGPGAQ